MFIQVCAKYATILHKVAMEMNVCANNAAILHKVAADMKVCANNVTILHKVAADMKVCANNVTILHKKEEVSFWAPPLGIFVGKNITSLPFLRRKVLRRQVLPLRLQCSQLLAPG